MGHGPPTVIRRLLIANRGEIAVRIIRTCQRLGIEAVLGASDADLAGVPARLADQVFRLGPSPAGGELPQRGRVVAAARAVGADAVHPGYGFLSESARLAEACERAGIVFVGPPAEQLAVVGDKLAARRHAMDAGLPVLPAARSVGRPRPRGCRAVGLAGARQGGRRWRWPGHQAGGRAGGTRAALERAASRPAPHSATLGSISSGT
jgi:biotin carboxylase